MTLIATCDRVGCNETADIASEGSYRRAATLADLELGDAVYVYLPEGWVVDRTQSGLDDVIHCPEHANAR